MDASNKQNTLAQKFASVWEKKNAKAARAGGASLMALSLAACGGSSDDTTASTVTDTTPVAKTDPAARALTTAEDTFVGTSETDTSTGNDTFTGTSATLSVDDNIVDVNGDDNDTLDLTLTAAIPVMDISGIENININWDSLLTPTADLDDVDGATVTLNTSKAGHNGNANVNNAAGNDVVFGAGFDGTVTVDGIEDASVTASAASTVTVGAGTAADGAVSVTAAVAETITVTGGDVVTVSAVAADDITIDGADAETINLTVGVDADVDLEGSSATATVANITNTAADAVELTIDNGSAYGTLALSGSINLNAEVADITAKTITGAGTVTISDAIDDMDTTDVDAAGFVFEAGAGANNASALTIASGQSFTFEDALDSAITIQTDADADGAADSANVTLEVETGAAAFIIDTADQEIETFTVTIDAAATFVDTQDFNIDDIQGNSAAGTAIVLVSADADVEVGLDDFDAASLDGSAVAGELTFAQTSNETLAAVGAAGATTGTFRGTTSESTFTSTNAADDSITFGTTEGGATAVFAGGDNTVLANAVTTGTLQVTAGAGDDVVELDGITTGTASLALGDGDNTVRVGATAANALAGATITMTTGTGDNTLVIEDATVAATTITVDFGTGNGTLDLSAATNAAPISIAAGTFSFTGLDTIAIGSATTDATVNATLLDGASFTITGDGTTTDHLSVSMTNTAAASVDFSGLTIAAGITTALAGLDVTGSAVADTIVGTDGDDDIGGGAGNDTITGGDGDDVINGDAGDDTIIIAFGGEGTDTITFAVADDVLDFSGTSDVVDGAEDGSVSVTAFEYITVAANATFVGGMNIVNSAIMGDVAVANNGALSDATLLELETYFADTDGAGNVSPALTFGDADDVVYAVVSDGTDSAILLLEDNDGDLAVDDTDITIIAHLIGVNDTDLVAANFADFV